MIDIGCGNGTNIAFFGSKGVNAVGVDVSQKLIKRGKQKYTQLQNVIFEGNALNLQFQDNTFDVAIIIGVLHHIYSNSDQTKAVREALRVVRDNGAVIICESNLINPLFRIFWNYIFPLTAKIDRFGGENGYRPKSYPVYLMKLLKKPSILPLFPILLHKHCFTWPAE